MIKKGYKILFQHFINNPDETSHELSEQIRSYFVNLMNKEPSVYYDLRRELYVMIMDNTLYVLTNQMLWKMLQNESSVIYHDTFTFDTTI